MFPYFRNFVHYFVVTIPLLLFGLIGVQEPMTAPEILSPANIQAAVLRYWLPGAVGLLIPPVLIWCFLGFRERTRV